jgi:aminoglycoside phosphotransferase (APT) family kinase protein
MTHAAGLSGADRARLAAFLTESWRTSDGGSRRLAGPLRTSLIAGGRSNPTYDVTDGMQHWILRRPPYGTVLPSSHDMAREVRIISALAGTTVPVPRVVATCDDAEVIGAPFYVMDRLDGRTYRTAEDTASLTQAECARLAESMVDTLVALHELEPGSVGLADWGRPDGYLERQLDRWGRQWEAVKTSDRPEVDQLMRALSASLPATGVPGIVHGDYKIDNVMVAHDDPGRILGVLDWEMATLGDTVADLGILVSFWDEVGGVHNPITSGATARVGFPTAREVIERYSERRGVPVEDIDWYVVFADFKIAVILEQIHARHLQGQTVGEWFADIGDMVGPLLERARARAAASTDPLLRR